MTGWELEKPNEDLLFKRFKKIRSFLKEYPLATISRDDSVLLIIRKYHPQLNCAPDDPNHPADNYRICLAYYTMYSYNYFELPLFDYLNISMTYDKNIANFAIIISAREMTRTTNIAELSKKLNNFEIRTEPEKAAIFERLTNEPPEVKKSVPITQTSVESGIIGTLAQGGFEDWWTSEEVAIPFWDNRQLAITFMDFNPNEDASFLEEADELLSVFLKKTATDRLSATSYVYRNCMDFLDAIGYDEEDDALWNMKTPEEVWQFVECTEIYISREPYEDKGVYLQLICDCGWEQEHGLQLVYNKQGRLIRVSAQDGHIMGWKGDGMVPGD
ncbi:DUF6985 domain-containing protein [Niabella beijingensis]|uniref:DUF6985 domain-containing protein n=1 Tax=Niabella beijingensis TaxID=2872700 RepID=UPI001CBCCFE8|nr:hypothetical protein [Niabella beijingensis]MBZ4191325.1 hypothetical protein [Niabella beijingensis]